MFPLQEYWSYEKKIATWIRAFIWTKEFFNRWGFVESVPVTRILFLSQEQFLQILFLSKKYCSRLPEFSFVTVIFLRQEIFVYDWYFPTVTRSLRIFIHIIGNFFQLQIFSLCDRNNLRWHDCQHVKENILFLTLLVTENFVL